MATYLDICNKLFVFNSNIVIRSVPLQTITLEDGTKVSGFEEAYLITRMEAFGKGELLEDGFKDLYIARKSSQIFVVYVKVNENFIVEKNIKVYKCDEGDTTLLQI